MLTDPKYPDPRARYPRHCESVNHEHDADTCYGWLRKCPVCERSVCYADGGAPDPPGLDGICDWCWVEVVESNPHWDPDA